MRPVLQIAMEPEAEVEAEAEAEAPPETPGYVLENRARLVAELVASVSNAYPDLHPAGFERIDLDTGMVLLDFAAGSLDTYDALPRAGRYRRAYQLAVRHDYFPGVLPGPGEFSENVFGSNQIFMTWWTYLNVGGEKTSGASGQLRSVVVREEIGRTDLVFFDTESEEYDLLKGIQNVATMATKREPRYGLRLQLADVDYESTLLAINDEPSWDASLVSILNPDLGSLPINVQIRADPCAGHSLPLLRSMVAGLDADQGVVLSNLIALRDAEDRRKWTHTLVAGPAGAGKTRTCFSAILAWDPELLRRRSATRFEVASTGKTSFSRRQQIKPCTISFGTLSSRLRRLEWMCLGVCA